MYSAYTNDYIKGCLLHRSLPPHGGEMVYAKITLTRTWKVRLFPDNVAGPENTDKVPPAGEAETVAVWVVQ